MTNPVQTAIQKLKNGEIIGIPTETVYGLAIDAGNNAAIDALYALKERISGKPFQIMVSTLDDAAKLVKIDARAQKLAKAFLPGPLSLVLSCREGDGTLAIRIPSHPLTHQLLVEFGKPIAATSANPSGETPAISAEEVKELYPQMFVLDGGKYCRGVASTVVDLTGKELKILREGPITKAQLTSRL
jgi:L-threonylcarbamoyladenylate synthase